MVSERDFKRVWGHFGSASVHYLLYTDGSVDVYFCQNLPEVHFKYIVYCISIMYQ